jgi:hypothetical protein
MPRGLCPLLTNLAAAWSVYPAAREDTELQRLDFHA